MVTRDRIRELALRLPGAVQMDHHGRPSFRVAGRIFATLWDATHVNVMLDEAGIRTVAEARSDACSEFWWGKRLGAVSVDLERADETLAVELLADAWESKASKQLLLLRDFGLSDEDARAWRESGLPNTAFAGWLTDRVARSPTGTRARRVYGAEDIHDFARRAILAALALGPDDELLEIGCGGGLLLRDALRTGARVTGIDHSQEMVDLARELAPQAGVVLAGADRLPFADGSFTALAMSVVFCFLADPVAVLRECRRVLRDGARVAIYTTAPELRGTPAAPEPIATEGHFHTDGELVALACEAGFTGAAVVNEDGGQLLTAGL